MKRGWRNDPAWIEHYRRRDEALAQRQIDRLKFEVQQARLQADVESSFRRMRDH